MIIVTFLAAALFTAVLVGGLILMRLATTREHREGNLPAHPTTRLAAAARAITGLYVEIPESRARASCGKALAGLGSAGLRRTCPATAPATSATVGRATMMMKRCEDPHRRRHHAGQRPRRCRWRGWLAMPGRHRAGTSTT